MTSEQRIAIFKELRADVVNDKPPSNGTMLYFLDLFEHFLETQEEILIELQAARK